MHSKPWHEIEESDQSYVPPPSRQAKETPQYRPNRRLGRCQNWSGHLEGKGGGALCLLEIPPQFLHNPVHSLFTTLTVLSWLLYTGRKAPMFQKNLLPLPSEQRKWSSKRTAPINLLLSTISHKTAVLIFTIIRTPDIIQGQDSNWAAGVTILEGQ
jgi:hypothetical protein